MHSSHFHREKHQTCQRAHQQQQQHPQQQQRKQQHQSERNTGTQSKYSLKTNKTFLVLFLLISAYTKTVSASTADIIPGLALHKKKSILPPPLLSSSLSSKISKCAAFVAADTRSVFQPTETTRRRNYCAPDGKPLSLLHSYHSNQPSFRLYSSYNNNDKYDEDDDDNYDDDEISPDNIDISNFTPPKTIPTFGRTMGARSSPSHRKAVGRKSDAATSVHICTNCGSEFVKWVGRCPTCREWNTVQEYRVGRGGGIGHGGLGGIGSSGKIGGRVGQRSGSSSKPRPVFSSKQQPSSSSWLDGVDDPYYGSIGSDNVPVPMTDIYKEMGFSNDDEMGGDDGTGNRRARERRIIIPMDEEINNVLGGGLMPGSLTLLGGDPGVGKSTLLLQIAGNVAKLSTPPRGIGMGMADEEEKTKKPDLGPVWYISGEENTMQVASRASRLGIQESELLLLCETDVDFIAEMIVSSYESEPSWMNDNDDDDDARSPKRRKPSLVVIDSIQTMVCEAGGSSAAGGITQVRECVALFLRLAKSTGISIVLVGHVTKSGDVAGPRTVEHMVDCVLYLEGVRGGGGTASNVRMLRASKNRFGSSEEVGVYEMNGSDASVGGGGRLVPVSDPSSLFLSMRLDTEDSEGCAVSLVLEGLRPITVEVQALVSFSAGGGGGGSNSRRTVDGISTSRLLLILAVLQKRCGISFHHRDVFVNVVGGMRLTGNGSFSSQSGSEADLAVAIALVSSLTGIPVRSDTAFVGEIGLLGEIRMVPSIDKRRNEARRMGFSRVITPFASGGASSKSKKRRGRMGGNSYERNIGGITWVQCGTLLDAINAGLVSKLPKKRKQPKGDSTQVSKIERDSLSGMEEGLRIESSPGSLKDLQLDIVDDDEEDLIFE